MSTPAQILSAPSIARFTLAPVIPLDKAYLKNLQLIAVGGPNGLSTWAENFEHMPAEETFFFDEQEWCGLDPKPIPHRLDLYTLQRGLLKVFDSKYDVSISTRQLVLHSLFEQHASPNILSMHPMVASRIVQLALFDQIVY